MEMKDQISNTIRSCYSQVRAIAKILISDNRFCKGNSAHLPHQGLGYIKLLLIELPDYYINKLQLIQNNAARLVMREKRNCHITPVLKNLHWLPVDYRIKYKILLLVYKCLCDKGPVYLLKLLELYTPKINLRSSHDFQLKDQRVQKVYGERAFAIAGPRLWNTLPLTIKNCATVSSFKTAIKTHFFNIHFKADEDIVVDE